MEGLQPIFFFPFSFFLLDLNGFRLFLGTDFSSERKKMATVTCSGGETTRIGEHVVAMSETLRECIDDDAGLDSDFSVPVQVSLYLMHVVETFCQQYKRTPYCYLDPQSTPPDWVRLFLDDLKHDGLIDLVMAADFLDNKVLYRACCWKLAAEMRDMTDDEIKKQYAVE
jgi:hypothetical protein